MRVKNEKRDLVVDVCLISFPVPDDGKDLEPQRRAQSPRLTPARLREVESLRGWWIKPQTVLLVPTEVRSVTLPSAAGSGPSSNGFIVVGLQWAVIKSPAFPGGDSEQPTHLDSLCHPLPQHPGHSHKTPVAFPGWYFPVSPRMAKICSLITCPGLLSEGWCAVLGK